MSLLLFSNNATSTVQSPIGPSAVTINLAPGTGARFPSPISGQIFIATLTDAATGLIKEIVNCTAISGDVVTVVRAQEGTSAQSWNAGDHFDNLWTAGSATAMLQQNQVPQFNNYAVDSGAVNALTITLSPAPLSLVSLIGTPIAIKIAHTNTSTTPTLNVNGFGPQPIKLWNASGAVALPVGWFPIGEILTFVWDGTQFQIGLELGYGTGLVFPGVAQPNTPSVTTSGYQKLPNNMILQWGSYVGSVFGGDDVNIVFPLPFTRQPSVLLTQMPVPSLSTARPIILNVEAIVLNVTTYDNMLVTGRIWSAGSAWVPVGSGGVANAAFVFNWSAVGPWQ